MKKEIRANDIIYMIAMFVMPIVTFIGVTKLQTDIIRISDVIKVGANDYNTLFLGDMILFISCWVALFISYFLYKTEIKLAQGLIFVLSVFFLGYNIYLAVNSYGSIASLVNPLIVLTTSLYALCAPITGPGLVVKEGLEVEEEIPVKQEEREEKVVSKTTKKTTTTKKPVAKKKKTTTTKSKETKSSK